MKSPSTFLPSFEVRQESSRSFRPEKLIDSIVDVVCTIDLNGIFCYVSGASLQLFGYRPDEMMGSSFIDFILPEDIQKTVQIVQERTPDCTTSNFENRYYRKDKTIIPVIWSGRWDEQDQLLYCVARDGSKKREIEERLVKAQQMARVANFEYDAAKHLFNHVSEMLYEICGLDNADDLTLQAETFRSLIHPDDRQEILQSFFKSKAPGITKAEYRLVRPDGEIVYLIHQREVITDHEGNHIRSIGVIQDISDRKRSELAIVQSERRFKSLVENGHDILGIMDAAGNYTYIGQNVEKLLGYTPADLLNQNAFAYIHPDDQERLVANLNNVLNGGPLSLYSFRFKNAAGEWRWLETCVSNHLDDPAVNGLVVNSRDITERKEADDNRAVLEQKFKVFTQNGSDLIVVINEEMEFSFVSDNVSDMLGYRPKELIGKKAFDFIHPAEHEAVIKGVNRVNKGELGHAVEHRFMNKKRQWIWLESKATNHIDNSTVRGLLVNSRNISERMELQRKLDFEQLNRQKVITSAVIKAQEIERSQIGLELHDNVNQILTTVKLYIELYRSGEYQGDELLGKSSGYLQDCINEIRSISKRLSAATLGNISLEDSITELLNSVNLTNRIQIDCICSDLKTIKISEDVHLAVYRIVQEGINNIIKYADATMAMIELGAIDKYLWVRITDNGKGFDTKLKTTGIGITNMKTRAESMNGSFKLRSRPGKGVELKVCIPIVN